MQALVEAARAEEESWKKWDTVSPLTDAESQRILSDPKARVIPSRAAYRDKSKQAGPLKAKCRVVCGGCSDPDLRKLNRDCSTPTCQAEYLLFCLFISAKNRRLFGGQDEWTLWGGDVKTAFLQGRQEDRDEPLYMRPPRDKVTQLAGLFKASLFLVKGNVYGLANAPRTWGLEVHKRRVGFGFQQHSLDCQMYYLTDKLLPGSNKTTLVCVMICYVDDFLITHNSKFDRQPVLKLFSWGSQEELSIDHSWEFKGKEIRLKFDEARSEYFLSFTQTKFIEALEAPKIKAFFSFAFEFEAISS